MQKSCPRPRNFGAGPRFSVRRYERFTPFAQVLFGTLIAVLLPLSAAQAQLGNLLNQIEERVDAVPGVRTAANYVGTAKCLTCHASAAAVWQGSAHAHAFATLAGRKADADPKCVLCHTVGFGSASGYRRELGGSKLVDAPALVFGYTKHLGLLGDSDGLPDSTGVFHLCLRERAGTPGTDCCHGSMPLDPSVRSTM